MCIQCSTCTTLHNMGDMRVVCLSVAICIVGARSPAPLHEHTLPYNRDPLTKTVGLGAHREGSRDSRKGTRQV